MVMGHLARRGDRNDRNKPRHQKRRRPPGRGPTAGTDGACEKTLENAGKNLDWGGVR